MIAGEAQKNAVKTENVYPQISQITQIGSWIKDKATI